MAQYRIKQTWQIIKNNLKETFKLLRQFKWYILPYMFFYGILLMNYFMPSPKNYFIWYSWCDYEQKIYIGTTQLLLVVFLLLFLLGTSNIRNHPWLAKIIFLSSLYFSLLLLEIV